MLVLLLRAGLHVLVIGLPFGKFECALKALDFLPRNSGSCSRCTAAPAASRHWLRRPNRSGMSETDGEPSGESIQGVRCGF